MISLYVNVFYGFDMESLVVLNRPLCSSTKVKVVQNCSLQAKNKHLVRTEVITTCRCYLCEEKKN